MTEEKYLALIHKQLSGNLTSTEQVELRKWLVLDKANQKTLDDFQAIWKLTDSVDAPFDIDVDKGFSKFQNRIEGDIKESEITTPKTIPMRRRMLQLAAALAFLVGAGFLFNLYNSTAVETNWITVTTGADEKKSVTLNDGTVVSINQNSNFKYPESFTSKTRSVQLVGEAFFDVARDESKPFVIDTKIAQVTVLGTSFNVREYHQELLTEVMVKSGQVKLSPKNTNEAVQLTAFKKGVCFHNDLKLKATSLNHLNDIAWHSGQVKFKSAPLSDVINVLNRQLNCTIQIENKQLLGCKYTGNFTNLKLDQIVEAIAISFGTTDPTFNSTKKHYKIAGGSCLNK